jgi:predicted MPP superfamily phosphohydrolase
MKTNWIPGFSMWVIASFLSAAALHADWSFVMLGDTRGTRDTTTTGVSLELPTIAQKIATLTPDLVMVAGDLVSGNDVPATSVLNDYALQFDNWKAAMQPVFNYSTNSGIPIFTVRGNHENMCSEGAPIPELKQAYYDAFHTYLPANGPVNSKDDNQVGFSYSFTQNNVTFVAADQYFYYDAASPDGYHALDQKWVSDQFAASSSTFKVLMAHVPVFQTEGGGESEHFFGDNAAGNQTRSDFWNTMGADGVQLYLCGHVHNESVATTPVTDGGTILQLMAGNGGAAPPDPIGNQPEPGVDVLHTSDRFGFSLATVGTDTMTIQYYTLNPADSSWSIDAYTTVIVPEPSPAYLLASVAAGLACVCLRKMGRIRRPEPDA